MIENNKNYEIHNITFLENEIKVDILIPEGTYSIYIQKNSPLGKEVLKKVKRKGLLNFSNLDDNKGLLNFSNLGDNNGIIKFFTIA